MLTQDTSSSRMFPTDASPLPTMDPSRNYRRMVPHKEVEFSSQSIMKAMESFVQAVQEMDETILVPSRLMDLEVGDSVETARLKSASKGKTDRDNLSSTDLFRLYNTVNSVRKELLWGTEAGNVPPEEEEEEVARKPVRRQSLVSLASSQSLSDTDSETGNENDSGIEAEAEAKPDYTRRIEEGFRRHLAGLQRSLAHMTVAAHYLTARYQSDISANV